MRHPKPEPPGRENYCFSGVSDRQIFMEGETLFEPAGRRHPARQSLALPRSYSPHPARPALDHDPAPHTFRTGEKIRIKIRSRSRKRPFEAVTLGSAVWI